MKADQSSKHLQGTTDLTLLAPIKQGLIDGLDTRTYKTRLKLLMKTLHSLRSSSREFAAIRPFSDGAERIRTIHSLRLAILEPEEKLLLAVTFDRPWEPYIRIIWRDVGTLLDVIFCNCAGYVTAFDHSFAEYFAWVRKAQIEAQFFYSATGLTVDDLQYLRNTERLHRESAGSDSTDLAAARLVIEDPADLALRTAKANTRQMPTDPPEETEKTALAALAALYRLIDVYPADKPDGGFLLRAAREILQELMTLGIDVLFPEICAERIRFKAQLEWLEQPEQPPRPAPRDRLVYDAADIQGGILTSYDGITHGCLVMVSIGDRAQAQAFIDRLAVTTEGGTPADGIYVNIAFTIQGLRRLGLPEPEIERFPKEFREGMEARADLLGDLRTNHPRKWTLPERNWPDGSAASQTVKRVELSEVDIVVQLRISSQINPGDERITGNPSHPLHARVSLLGSQPGVQIVSVEPMLGYRDPSGATIDHFGFVDGISQPVVESGPALRDESTRKFWNNQVKRNRDRVSLGEILCGYVNDLKDEPPPAADGAYLDNGTFLVVRKLYQNVKALDDVASQAGIPVVVLKEKMLGRKMDGTPLAEPSAPDKNDFDYSNDKEGAKCPFHAHIRRANPRGGMQGKPIPRIMRRGMSYGPLYPSQPSSERGLMFLAYNASIAEQFEVIQRWMSGGNSSGVYSGQGDPFVGVPQRGDPRTFWFQDASRIRRIDLDPGGSDESPFVRLEWGTYLFVPSITTLKKISSLQDQVPSTGTDRGEEIVQRLLAMEAHGTPPNEVIEAWKAVLEELEARNSGDTAAVWAAIRKHHGGILRTAYGVLAGCHSQIMKIFENVDGNYSVAGYQARLRLSIGEMFLGMDEGPDYRAQSTATNLEIQKVGERAAFDEAYRTTRSKVLRFFMDAERKATFDTRELSDQTLAELSKTWFDLPDGANLEHGGWGWAPISARKPQCPGDFTSPSRYTFSPNPGSAATDYGRQQGRAVREAVGLFVARFRGHENQLKGSLSKAMFAAIPDDGQLARTLAGVMMGFLPTVDGILRSVLFEWMDDKSLWRLQEALASDADSDRHAAAKRVLKVPLMRAMQRRPVPDLVWRTAVKDHHLGSEHIKTGDTIVLGIGSATQEELDAGHVNVAPIFGGIRKSPPPAPVPTHACPAYDMAIGVLLGILSALLDAGTLRPTPSPTGLELTGK